MQCIVYTGQESSNTNDNNSNNNNNNSMMVMQQQRRPTPRPGKAGHVLIQVVAVGLNPVDAKLVVGDKLPPWMQYMVRKTLLARCCNIIPGFDFSGIVVDIDGHEGFRQGDAVFGCLPPLQGTLAEYISAPTHQVAYLPTRTSTNNNNNNNNEIMNSFIQAAALPLVGLTALQGLSRHIPSRTSCTTSILVIGASGGVGHVALQVARALGATHRTAICSLKNKDFVMRQCGATTVIDYNSRNSGTNTMESILEQLYVAPGCPYSIVLDCVTSADIARDTLHMDYRQLVRQLQARHMLTDDYVHIRLGGPTRDWLRAGWERIVRGSKADVAITDTSSSSSISRWLGNCCWGGSRAHEKLFWIRLSHSSQQLQTLAQMAQGSLSPNGTALYQPRNYKLRVQIQDVYPMTAENVNFAFQQLLSRRVQGKIVIVVHDLNNNNKK
jgi:reticulon-4-interacting protein 1, mitochondrial